MENGYGVLLGAFAFLGFFAVILAIAAYVLTAFGLYKIAQKIGEPNAWLAWIPIAQFYIIGKIIVEIKLGTLLIPRMELVLPLGAVGVAIIGSIPFIGGLIGLAYYALFMYSLYLFFKKYDPEQAVLYTVLSIVGLFPIFIFVIRDKNQVA